MLHFLTSENHSTPPPPFYEGASCPVVGHEQRREDVGINIREGGFRETHHVFKDHPQLCPRQTLNNGTKNSVDEDQDQHEAATR